MLSVLRHRTYRRLFAAQAVALLGTGLATVALSLLAYDLAGPDASAVLGTALAVKMLAYVAVPPVVGAVAARVPRRSLLVAMDAVRAAVALVLPFVTQVWQVYVLILLLQAASAAFTPAFQAVIPALLPEERDYTRALSLSRLAYDLEAVLSPALAAVLLSFVSYTWLFAGTTAGFLASAALVATCVLPGHPAPDGPDGPDGPDDSYGRRRGAVSGVRLFLATPRLRALLALDLAVAAAGAMVVVNTVVLVRDDLERGAGDVSLALGAYGVGSMVSALLLPGLLERARDRSVMLAGAFALPAVLAAHGLAAPAGAAWPALLAAWAALGAACSAVLTPVGRLVRRSTASEDLPAAFAAQFSLSHGCWLLTYPAAGWLAASAGTDVAHGALAALALVGAGGAALIWPARDPVRLDHHHDTLPPGHPHLAAARATASGFRHSHDFVIDRLHPRWPAGGRGAGGA
ncbi:MFS transporter [Streptomyces marincola]|uniref:MFS transporter n=1 Tax=Streptomyces marincola TaxID=2878388 RepID=A0A1W7D0R6_9ACTN|nr:MFS transporter [Streptomyces marincola]ARQ70691.1 MFS transporter [Streptomyces marincola]